MRNIVAILDRSYSMLNSVDEVISTYNRFIEDQKKLPDACNVTLAIFDDQYKLVYSDVSINAVAPLDIDTYYARGSTALYDAIGKTIARDLEGDAIVLIMTDGFENCSKEFSHEELVKLIDKRKQKDWKFEFIGAEINAESNAKVLGIDSGHTLSKDAAGFENLTQGLNNKVASYRSNNYIAAFTDNDTQFNN